jgi:DNA-directed RNA polymerase subunit RPC12/RpoP
MKWPFRKQKSGFEEIGAVVAAMTALAKMADVEVVLSIETRGVACKECGKTSLVLVRPNRLCPPCWSLTVVAGWVEKSLVSQEMESATR